MDLYQCQLGFCELLLFLIKRAHSRNPQRKQRVRRVDEGKGSGISNLYQANVANVTWKRLITMNAPI